MTISARNSPIDRVTILRKTFYNIGNIYFCQNIVLEKDGQKRFENLKKLSENEI